jgi:SAM-dependent methyltransferase
LGQHYGTDYHGAITRAAEGSEERWKAHQRTVSGLVDAGAILDIGCGAGLFLQTFRDTSWRLHGIELSPAVAQVARERTGADVFVGDVMAASFPDASLDAVTSFDVLEHMHNPRDVMNRIWRWLKPGGVFYVFVPNVACLEARVFGSYWFGLELPRHLFHFSPRSLRSLMASEGFDEEWLVTPPLNYIEHSLRYAFDSVYAKTGRRREPLASARTPSLPFRVMRKAVRLTALSLFEHTTAVVKAGPAIEAVFRKREASREVEQ